MIPLTGGSRARSESGAEAGAGAGAGSSGNSRGIEPDLILLMSIQIAGQIRILKFSAWLHAC